MPQSLSMIYLHVIFSTKNREPFLADAAVRQRVHAFLGGVCRTLDAPALDVGGTEDHVHIACSFPTGLTVKEFIKEVKRVTSTQINRERWLKSKFHWQSGYGAFSLSPSHLEQVRTYIRNQMEHHTGEGFQEEFRRILDKYKVEYDERYVWD